MIAKEVAMPKTGGSFRGLVSYLTSSRGATERVGVVRLTNCVSANVRAAVLEVENLQARNCRARHKTYHLVLSFREDPPGDVLERIEQRACAALGLSDHHRVSVVHHDTDHLHVHVAINLVHPSTHRMHWPSYSKLALDGLCVELELEYGLVPDRHRTHGREHVLRGLAELRGYVQGKCADALRQAQSWAEIHAAAQQHGLHVQTRGNGLVLVSAEGISLKASTVARDFSKAALERRLGPFEPGPGQASAPSIPVRNTSVFPLRAPDMEAVAGVESLAGFIQRHLAPDLGLALTSLLGAIDVSDVKDAGS